MKPPRSPRRNDENDRVGRLAESRSIALHGHRWHAREVLSSIPGKSLRRSDLLPRVSGQPIPSSPSRPSRSSRRPDGRARNGTPRRVGRRSGGVAARRPCGSRARGRGEHVVALAVGLGHDPLIGPVEVQLPAAEVDVSLGRRDPRVGRQPCGELTLEPGLVGWRRAGRRPAPRAGSPIRVAPAWRRASVRLAVGPGVVCVARP